MLWALTMGCNIAQVIRHWSLCDPTRTALVLCDPPLRELSYGMLDERACRVAARLEELGMATGDRLALCVQNGIGFVDAWFGGLYAGCTLVPIPPMSSSLELAERLHKAGCRALVADASPQVQQALRLRPEVALLDPHTLATGERLRDAPADLSAESIAMLLYTSGTTGSAKGAMITHGSLAMHTANLVHHVLRLRDDDRVLAALPLTHSYGIRMTLLAPFYVGARTFLLERFRPAQVLGLLASEQIGWFPGVPTMFHALAHESTPPKPSALRWCLSAGAPLPRALRLAAERKLGVPIRQGYGLTEATFSTIASPDDVGAEDTVGRPVFGVALRIVDAAGLPLPPGQLGEVCVRGPNVMAGYLDEPEATATCMRDGWLHSGDLGVLDALGRLTVVDRIKDMIIRGGFNVYPAEVEAALIKHPCVRDAAVVGVPDAHYGEEVLAVLVLQPDHTLDPDELSAFCREQLSRVKVPRLLAVLDALPVGGSGKVQRRELKLRALAGELPLVRLPTAGA